MFLSKKKRIYGRIVHARRGMTSVNFEIEVPKAAVAKLFTGHVELERLHDLNAGITINVIDTKKEELQRLEREKAVKRKEMQRLQRESVSKMVDKSIKK